MIAAMNRFLGNEMASELVHIQDAAIRAYLMVDLPYVIGTRTRVSNQRCSMRRASTDVTFDGLRAGVCGA
jgi:hypothetical protein